MAGASGGGGTSIVEHVVLFDVDDDEDPAKVNTLINGILSLNALDQVLYLTAGPILRLRSSPFKFTHLIHGRFRTKDDLAAYTTHPAHQKVAVKFALPISRDMLALDWTLDSLTGPVVPHPGRAIRVAFFKFKEGGAEAEKEKGELMQELGRIRESLLLGVSGQFLQFSFGENFSPGRDKGYSVGLLVIFRDLNELDASEVYEDKVRLLLDRFKAVLDGFVAVDYVVPRAHLLTTTTI
ncbi:hypothetical protein Dimus_002798 [Dionaea muscipula]